MALLPSEVARLKFELGFGLLTNNAAAYARTTALFEQGLLPYLSGGAVTSSSTAVVAASAPTPAALTLASATGFAAGDRVIVDVDARQEAATIQSIAGSAITVLLSLAHAGTYPVTVEGPESMLRGVLGKLREMGESIAGSSTSAGLRSVGRGAVEWYGDGSSTVLRSLQSLQMHHRDELASMLGIANMWRERQSSGRAVSLY